MLALLLALLAQDLAALTDGWRSSDPAARDQTTADILARWKDWSDADLASLTKLKESADQEVASRAGQALERIALRRGLGDILLARIPKLEETLLAGEPAGLAVLVRGLWRARKAPAESVRCLFETAAKHLRLPAGDALMTALEETERVECVPLLRAILRDADDEIVKRCLGRMVALKLRTEAAAIAPLLAHKEMEVRTAALSALAQWDAKEQVAKIIPLLADSCDEVVGSARSALARLADRSYIPAIAVHFGNERAFIRESVLRTLGTLGDAPELRLGLKDTEGGVRLAAVENLRELGLAETFVKELSALKGDGEDYVRSAVLLALSEAPGIDTSTILVAALDDPEPAVQRAALDALGTLRLSKFADACAQKLTSNDAGVRATAMNALVSMGAKDHVIAIAKLIGDRDLPMGGLALRALALLGSEAHVPDLVKALGSSEADEFYSVRYGLRDLRTPAAAEALRKGADARTLEALSHYGLHDDLPTFLGLLRSRDTGVLQAAARGVAACGGKPEDLAALTRHRDPFVRAAAFEAQIRMGHADALARLARERDSHDAVLKLLSDVAVSIARLPDDLLPMLRDRHRLRLLPVGEDDEVCAALLRFGTDDDVRDVMTNRPRPDRTLIAALSARFEPRTLETLRKQVTPAARIDSFPALQRLFNDHGVELRVLTATPPGFSGVIDKGMPLSLLDALGHVIGRSLWTVSDGVVIIATPEEAARSWTKRLK